jgi:RNA chaperone Hfq
MTYLKSLVQQDERVTVFLTNGVKLMGQIRDIEEGFDQRVTAFILDRSGHSQLVLMHAVATVVPETPPVIDGNRA